MLKIILLSILVCTAAAVMAVIYFYPPATVTDRAIEKLDKLIAADKYRDSLLLRIEERHVEEFQEMRKEIESLKKELKSHKHPYLAHVHPCECTQQSVDAYTKKIQEYKKQALKPGE